MSVLDTNVISELTRKAPDPGVLAWLELEVCELATTAVIATELRYGVARLPDGHRKREPSTVIRGVLAEDFYGRFLPVYERATVRCGYRHRPRPMGRPIGIADAQSAATCRDLRAILATRDAPDFAETGIELIDPRGWAGLG